MYRLLWGYNTVLANLHSWNSGGLCHCWPLSWHSPSNNLWPLDRVCDCTLQTAGSLAVVGVCVWMQFLEKEKANAMCAHMGPECLCTRVCMFAAGYCCTYVGTHITVPHLESVCTILCNLISTAVTTMICVCVCLKCTGGWYQYTVWKCVL